MIDENRIHAEMVTRIRHIRESPLGLEMKPLAAHLAFDTQLSARECMAILWAAAESIRAPRCGGPAEENQMRLQ